MIAFKSKPKFSDNDHLVLIIESKNFKSHDLLNKDENSAVKKAIDNKQSLIVFNNGTAYKIIVTIDSDLNWKTRESLRKNGAKICAVLNEAHIETISILATISFAASALAEGIALANYQFLKYKTEKNKKAHSLKEIGFLNKVLNTQEIETLRITVESTNIARDLVNEPQSFLNALQLSEEFKRLGKQSGFKVDVWSETKIAAQKMGGILAVNKGSKIPPTFNIMEYKPKDAKNKQAIVLVGKGIVYDTGGLSLKPTPMSMDYMKCDMAGSAVVAGVMYAVAKLNLPIYVVGLVPATDNWIGEDSYAPGDVITMYSGASVEILNTDAEGRLVLADALHYAKKLKPELVIDFATLTGAAVRAIGPYASAMMGTAGDAVKQDLFESSYEVFERLIEFPLWDEYGDELKSEVADFTNLGKGEGGQISAAKFLEKFTDYPWMHIDIAGTAFNHANKAYNPIGGTGVGVRLMIDFLQKQATKKPSKK
jgi:leucyl aminopeptidase